MNLSDKIFRLLFETHEKEKIENKKIYVTTSAISKKFSIRNKKRIRSLLNTLSKFYDIETVVVMRTDKTNSKIIYEYAFRLEKI